MAAKPINPPPRVKSWEQEVRESMTPAELSPVVPAYRFGGGRVVKLQNENKLYTPSLNPPDNE